MATSFQQQQKGALRTETAGSAIEGAAGLAVIVLAIIGLSSINPGIVLSIGVIVLGAAMFIFGAAIASEYARLLAAATSGTSGAGEIGAGMTVEILAGGTAVILGILGLIGLSPGTLLPAAIITVGAGLILGASSFQSLTHLKAQTSNMSDIAQSVARATVGGAIATQVLAGAAAIVLGILALTTRPVATLTEVGMLVLGVALVVSGMAVSGRMLRVFGTR